MNATLDTLEKLRNDRALARAEAARGDESYDALDAIPEGDPNAHVVAWSIHLDEVHDKIQHALAAELEAGDVPRMWTARQDDIDFSLGKLTRSRAREEACQWVHAGDYCDRAKSTSWVTVQIDCAETGEGEFVTVQIDPEEPPCIRGGSGEHDWQSPHEILGGLRENPGVWGRGAGVIIREVCMLCGCERETNTWAQNPENGEQGLESISYDEGKYAHEVDRINEEEAEMNASNKQSITIKTSYPSQGEFATTAEEATAWAENLAAHVCEEFGGEVDVTECVGDHEVFTFGFTAERELEIKDFVRDIMIGDGWIDLLPESAK